MFAVFLWSLYMALALVLDDDVCVYGMDLCFDAVLLQLYYEKPGQCEFIVQSICGCDVIFSFKHYCHSPMANSNVFLNTDNSPLGLFCTVKEHESDTFSMM